MFLKLLAKTTLIFSIFILIFSNMEEYAVSIQIAGVSLVYFSGLVCLIIQYKINNTFKYLPSIFDLWIISTVVVSLIVSLIRQNDISGYYTLVFMGWYCSVMLIVRVLTEKDLCDVAICGVGTSVLFVWFYYFGKLALILTPGAADRWDLRFSPFDMHPDLTGFVYCGFSILAFFLPIRSKKIEVRVLLYSLFFGSILIALAASARAALIALLVTIVIYGMSNIVNSGRMRYLTAISLCGSFIFLFVYNENVVSYFSEILELESNTRGWVSGGSGRMDLWKEGLNLIGDNAIRVILGSGLRSASPEAIGFSTESSYITVALESGVISLFGLLIYFVSLALRIRKSNISGQKTFKEALYFLLIYVCIQSIFNRYLIAIGNPLSMIFLIFVSKEALKDTSRRTNEIVTPKPG